MMDSPELILLDVGHGNCAIVRVGDRAVVVDAPARPVVHAVLDALGIKRIDKLLLSHADVDHFSGAAGLLANAARPVGEVWVNPDSSKRTAAWTIFRTAVRDAREKRGTTCHSALTSTTPGSIDFFDVTFEVLYPTPEVALGGVGGEDLVGRSLTSNGMSAVIRVKHRGVPVCLLAADLDDVALQNVMEACVDCAAPLLVFPHHGGRSGAKDGQDFARRVARIAKSDVVFFSMSRNAHSNPRPEIIAGVVGELGDAVHIACSQLSKRCADSAPLKTADHLMNMAADGHSRGICCAGTVVVEMNGNDTKSALGPLFSPHRKFVETLPKRMCKFRR